MTGKTGTLGAEIETVARLYLPMPSNHLFGGAVGPDFGTERMISRFAGECVVPRHLQRNVVVPSGAFLGDPALKAEILSCVQEGWETRRIIPSVYLKWSSGGGFTSLAGMIGRTQNPDEFNARTGLTIELALLCETLINCGITFEDEAAAPMGFVMRGDDAIWSFGVEWLSAIAVNRDVSDVVVRFLPVFLREILSADFALADDVPPEVRKAADEILNLWAREAWGEAVSRQAWRSVRASALRASEGNCGPRGPAVAHLVESLAWPSDGIAKEFPAIVRKFLLSYQQALAARFLTNQDRIAWAASLAAESELAQLRSQPQYASMTEKDLLDRFPEIGQAILRARHLAVAARIDDAMRRARTQSVPFLRRQMDGLLDLLGEKPG